MRVFISTMSEDLKPFGDCARALIRECDWCELTFASSESLESRKRAVRRADLLVVIAGWHQGPVPPPVLGGDGRKSFTELDVQAAFQNAQPVIIMRADDDQSTATHEGDPVIRAWVADFRAELDRIAVGFSSQVNEASLSDFRETLRAEIERHRSASWLTAVATRELHPEITLRRWPHPRLPAMPYPLLLPHTCPELLMGRDREINEVNLLLRRQVPILGLHARSGAGKSSMICGGLVPGLRAAGQPVACDRNPHEPGLSKRLLGDLIDEELPDDDGIVDAHAFVDHLLEVARHAGEPPLLVLDQFEDVLRSDHDARERRRARAVVGILLSATIQRLPNFNTAPCRWLLVYRREFHGAVLAWLQDVLREARGEGLNQETVLPHDLSGPHRFHSWAMPELGAARPGDHPLQSAQRIFRDAIEGPLRLKNDDGTSYYNLRFAGDGAARLAGAFAAARVRQPRAPLAPELQVVLAYLLATAGEPEGEQPVLITVPPNPGDLIDRALEEHLARALASALPGLRSEYERRTRTRALLALRELADASGRCGDALSSIVLERAIGAEGRDVLECFATAQTRLVVPEQGPEGKTYALAHDRLAEVVVRAVDDEGRQSGIDVDPELLALRRFVTLRTDLFRSGEETAATDLPSSTFHRISENGEALLWGESRVWWFKACVEARQKRLRKRFASISFVVLVLAAVGFSSWRWAASRAERQALLEQIATGEPGAALAAFAEAITQSKLKAKVSDMLMRRDNPADLLELGLSGIAEEDRAEIVLEVVRETLPLVENDPENPVLIASLAWALDFFPARNQLYAAAARELKIQLLSPLWRIRPPPPLPSPYDPLWPTIPEGEFLMGSAPGQGRDDENMLDERPQHQVVISSFRLCAHETTAAEFRRLVPEISQGVGEDNLPVLTTWYQAYTYAAWCGGRLPTEAEWEYAARANCEHSWCDRHGAQADVSDVAWWVENADDSRTLDPDIQAVMQLEPNAWSLFDMFGNVWEWTADWYGEYSPGKQVDPIGPTVSEHRVFRGGDCLLTATWVQAQGRGANHPTVSMGFRVLLPITDETP